MISVHMTRETNALAYSCQCASVLASVDSLVNNLGMEQMPQVAITLQWLMDSRSVSQNELARATGVSQPTIGRILKGQSKAPETKTLGALAAYFGVTVDDLLGRSREPISARVVEPLALPGSIPVVGHHDEDSTPAGFIALQAITLEVGAGHRLTEGQEPETKARLYSLESLQRQRLRPSDLVAYKVRGNSMEPYLFDGDWVVIDRSRKMPPSIAKPLDCRCNTFVFRYEDGIMVKMLQTLPDGGFNVVSLNRAEHKEFMIPASSVDRMEVYGKVVDRSGWSV